MKRLIEQPIWISTEVIKVLKHNLNFSNWTDTYTCESKWEIEIYMPTSRCGEEHSGFFTLFRGRIEFNKTGLFYLKHIGNNTLKTPTIYFNKLLKELI